ncbi:hypothetical protein DA391_23385 (plasmid) [Yersinia massiliensis]|uniref:Uncharacterized protein n=1 Tax=Yersinia massiliensis TaxID=419257 RepID=A0ABM6V0E8_9GAMM|nr:hypothetical protein DA391_23385 [Yersinia massiliensis]
MALAIASCGVEFDVIHQTLAEWPETCRGSAETAWRSVARLLNGASRSAAGGGKQGFRVYFH